MNGRPVCIIRATAWWGVKSGFSQEHTGFVRFPCRLFYQAAKKASKFLMSNINRHKGWTLSLKGLSHIHGSHHGSSQIIAPGSSVLSPASPCIHRAGIRCGPWRIGIPGEKINFPSRCTRMKNCTSVYSGTENSSGLIFLITDMPVSQGSHRCLPGVYTVSKIKYEQHGMILEQTNPWLPCCDPWMSERSFNESKELCTSVKRLWLWCCITGTQRIKISGWSVVRSVNVWKALKGLAMNFNWG